MVDDNGLEPLTLRTSRDNGKERKERLESENVAFQGRNCIAHRIHIRMQIPGRGFYIRVSKKHLHSANIRTRCKRLCSKC